MKISDRIIKENPGMMVRYKNAHKDLDKTKVKTGNYRRARIMKYLLLLILLSGCASTKSKYQNDSVADRLRQRHAPVKTHNPSIK